MLNSKSDYQYITNKDDLTITGKILPVRDLEGTDTPVKKREDIAFLWEAINQFTLGKAPSQFLKAPYIVNGTNLMMYLINAFNSYCIGEGNLYGCGLLNPAIDWANPTPWVFQYPSWSWSPDTGYSIQNFNPNALFAYPKDIASIFASTSIAFNKKPQKPKNALRNFFWLFCQSKIQMFGRGWDTIKVYVDCKERRESLTSSTDTITSSSSTTYKITGDSFAYTMYSSSRRSSFRPPRYKVLESYPTDIVPKEISFPVSANWARVMLFLNCTFYDANNNVHYAYRILPLSLEKVSADGKRWKFPSNIFTRDWFRSVFAGCGFDMQEFKSGDNTDRDVDFSGYCQLGKVIAEMNHKAYIGDLGWDYYPSAS